MCFETPDSCFVVVSGPRYIYTLDIAHSLFVGGYVWCMVCGVLLVACGCVGGGVSCWLGCVLFETCLCRVRVVVCVCVCVCVIF